MQQTDPAAGGRRTVCRRTQCPAGRPTGRARPRRKTRTTKTTVSWMAGPQPTNAAKRTCLHSASPCYFGAPGEIRTPGRLVRSQVLYPAELRARICLVIICILTSCVIMYNNRKSRICKRFKTWMCPASSRYFCRYVPEQNRRRIITGSMRLKERFYMSAICEYTAVGCRNQYRT